VQYYGEDCKALAVTVGGLASIKELRIWTSKKKLETWLLTRNLDVLFKILDILSDDGSARFFEWLQSVDSVQQPFEDVRFEPRYLTLTLNRP
jgi:hypothetical protein